MMQIIAARIWSRLDLDWLMLDSRKIVLSSMMVTVPRMEDSSFEQSVVFVYVRFSGFKGSGRRKIYP